MARKKIDIESNNDITHTDSCLQVVNKDIPLSELLDNIDSNINNVVLLTLNPTIGTSVSCIGVLLEKNNSLLSIAYPYVLVFDDNNRGTSDDIKLFPFTGLDFTDFTGNTLADGTLNVNTDNINNGYLIYSSSTKHPFIKMYLEELHSIVKYIN